MERQTRTSATKCLKKAWNNLHPAFLALGWSAFALMSPFPAAAQSAGEKDEICEAVIEPCMEPSMDKKKMFRVHESVMAIRKNGFNVCETMENISQVPDIVLIMDNTGSMGMNYMHEGIPRYCANVELQRRGSPDDPECISGDPDSLRGPALRTFIDSALVKSEGQANVGTVLFNESAYYVSNSLLPLTPGNRQVIKDEIVMRAERNTNYTAAFNAAMRLLETSEKPKSQQIIIFISDGRPSYPGNDPHAYKHNWDDWPAVYGIFLGANKENYQDMRDISTKTGGQFFAVKDVKTLASLLVKDILPRIIQAVYPAKTVVTNQTTGKQYMVPEQGHVFHNDKRIYTLELPGPVYLQEGGNTMTVQTEFTGGASKSVTFEVLRTKTGPFSPGNEVGVICRSAARITLLNKDGRAISDYGEPYTIMDGNLRYRIVTGAEDLDTFSVEIKTRSGDLEFQKNSKVNLTAPATWENSLPFRHGKAPIPGDLQVQTVGGELITVSYRNPYIPIDTATVTIGVSYGPKIKHAVYRDLNGDGRVETVVITFDKSLFNLPEKFEFALEDANGKREIRIPSAQNGEITFAKKIDGSENRKVVAVTLARPFPRGLTYVSPTDSSGKKFDQANIPLEAGKFYVADSVPPQIVEAEVILPDEKSPYGRVKVRFSEPVSVPPVSTPLIFKKGDKEFPGIKMIDIQPVGNSYTEFLFFVDPNNDILPVGGDSVAVNPASGLADLNGTIVTNKLFTRLSGSLLYSEKMDFYVSEPQKDKPMADLSRGVDHRFVLVGKNGKPLPGISPGKCGDCFVGENGKFVGPVFYIETIDAFKYRLDIFSNLGTFISSAIGEVTGPDLSHFSTLPNQKAWSHPVYLVRLVWNGLASDGEQIGSGAYVVKGIFHHKNNPMLGTKLSTTRTVKTFGYLRQ